MIFASIGNCSSDTVDIKTKGFICTKYQNSITSILFDQWIIWFNENNKENKCRNENNENKALIGERVVTTINEA